MHSWSLLQTRQEHLGGQSFHDIIFFFSLRAVFGLEVNGSTLNHSVFIMLIAAEIAPWPLVQSDKSVSE